MLCVPLGEHRCLVSCADSPLYSRSHEESTWMLPRAVSSAKSRCPLWRVAVDPLRSLSPQTSPSFPSHLTVPRNHPTTQLRATVTNPDVRHALTNRLPCARHTRASIEASLNGMVLTPCCCRCSPDASMMPERPMCFSRRTSSHSSSPAREPRRQASRRPVRRFPPVCQHGSA